MPIWRKLHVKTTDSLDFNDMPDDFTRLTWVLLTLKVCKEGRGLDIPAWIKSQLFPLRSDVTLEQVESCVGWYQERGMITRYKAKGRPYFQINSWHEYQNTSRDAKSPYPEPTEIDKDKKDIDIDIEAVHLTNSRASQELVKSNSNTQKNPHISIHSGIADEITDLDNTLQVQGMITTMSKVTKTACTYKTELDFKEGARIFIERGWTEQDVLKFPAYWKANGWYDGKPALKTLIDEMPNMMEGQKDSFLDGLSNVS